MMYHQCFGCVFEFWKWNVLIQIPTQRRFHILKNYLHNLALNDLKKNSG
jgi:hypothetical protein